MGRLLKDLSGKRFGRWIVISHYDFIEYKKGSRNHRWLCKCDCGNEGIVFRYSLISGSSQSCGCLNNELCGNLNRLPYGESSFKLLYSRYKADAKRRNLSFELTK